MGFGANDANVGGTVMEANLTIGNGNHTRNLSGFFTKIFGGSNIFTEMRVFRNSANSWDIAVYHGSFVHKTIVQVVHSGTRFIPNFKNYINTPNPSGDNIYNITEYKGNGMDIGALQEITEPTNIYDFFPLKEYSGGNKKVTLEGLRKWILQSMYSGSIVRGSQEFNSWSGDSSSVAVPKGALVTLYIHTTNSNGSGTIQTSNNNTSWNDIAHYTDDSYGNKKPDSSITIVVPP